MPFSLKLAVHRPRWQGNVVCRDATATRKPRDTLPTGAEGGDREVVEVGRYRRRKCKRRFLDEDVFFIGSSEVKTALGSNYPLWMWWLLLYFLDF